MKLNKPKKIVVAFAVVTIAATILFSSASMALSTADPFSAPVTFQPVQTTRVSFDVYPMGDMSAPIGTIVVGEGSAEYTDLSHVYPSIGVFRSNAPYQSDAAGTYTGSETITTSQERVIGDHVFFKHEAWFTYDLGARTYTSFPALRTDTYRSITPVAGLTVDHWSGGSMTFTTDLHETWGFVPQGTMIVSVDMGTSPWTVKPYGSARISKSLEPINYDQERLGTPTVGYTFADAINRLASRYGNTAVTVVPRITITAVNNFEHYTYEQRATLSNGTAVTMTLQTTNALVGFEDAYVSKYPWSGIIPKAYTDDFDRAGLDYTDTGGTQGGTPDSDSTASSDAMTAILRYTGDYTLPGGNEITRIIRPVDAWTSIDSITPTIDWNMIEDGQNSLPEAIDISAQFDLQPVTTIKVANMQATGTVKSYYYFDPIEYQPYSVSYQYPYGVQIDNVASMFSMTLKVDLFTNNEIQMVTSSGLPVDITKLVDFDLGSIIGNPSADDMVFKVKTESWFDAFLGMFSGMFGQFIQVVAYILVIVIVVGVIYVIAQFKKR